MGLRKVGGAHRRNVISQFLFESFLFTLVALPVSLGLTQALLPLFSTLMGQSLVIVAGAVACPNAYLLMQKWLRIFAYRIDLTVWLFLSSIAITFLVAVATVVHLARKATRTNPVDVLSQE